MPGAVVTKQTVHDVNSQEHLRKIYSLAVVRILNGTHWDGSADHPVGWAIKKRVACCTNEFLCYL